ncbi:hypothetical protein [Rhodococcus koreensis]
MQKAIDDGDPVTIAELPKAEYETASNDQRFRAINILLDNNKGGADQIRADIGIPKIWDSFKGTDEAISQRPAEWERSLREKRNITASSHYFGGLRKLFFRDVVHVVTGYLNENEQFCKAQFPRLGLDEHGKVMIGPPTKQQTDELARLRPEAQKIAADKEAMSALRNVECGYSVKESLPGGAGDEKNGSHEGERVKFDPDPVKKPPGAPAQGEMKTWDEVNEQYQNLHQLVAARLAANPVLAAMDRESDEARQGAQKVASATREEALEEIGRSLIDTLANIAQTRKLLSPTMVEEFKPVHQQLVTGKVPTVHQPPDRQWEGSPVLRPAGQAIVEELSPEPVEVIAKAVGMFALYAVIGFVTGGTALAVAALAQDAAEMALQAGKAEALATAAGTNVTAETTLVTRGQVDEARAALIEKAAFAFLDIAGGISAVGGALKEVVQFEKQAATAAQKARSLADKWMQSGEKAVPVALLAETEAAAKEARAGANGANSRKGAVGADGAARAEVAAATAEKEAGAAESAAADMKASLEGGHGKAGHPEPIAVGGHKVGVRGVWVTRCSESPCSEIASSITARVRKIFIKGPTRNPAHWVFNEQLNDVTKAAADLQTRARRELIKYPVGHPSRVNAEKLLNQEGAAVEREMQRLENLEGAGLVETTTLREGIHGVASNLERTMVAKANAIFSRMPKPPKGKCIAMSESGTPMISGYATHPERAASVAEHAAVIDAALVENRLYDKRFRGEASASHSEKMAGIAVPGEPIAVALPMCANCYAFFAQEAKVSGLTQVVAEPHLTNVFFADGVRVSIDRAGHRTVIGPSGSISTTTTPAIPGQ